MRLLLVNYEYPPAGGGAATATRELARAFARSGHDVAVLASGAGGDAEARDEDGVRVVRISTGRARDDRATRLDMLRFAWKAIPSAARVASARRVDAALVFFSLPCGPVGWRLRARHGIPYVLSLRGGDVPGFLPELDRAHALLAPLRRACLRGAHAVVANSQALADLARRADGGPVTVIPNGVDTEAFAPRADRGPPDRVRFLFVGRLARQKRVDLLLAAFARLASPSHGLDAWLAIVGDGPERTALESQARDLGVAGAVTFRGWVPRAQLREHYGAADCLVLPSDAEGMSNTLLEAMASGVPAIASDNPGNRELLGAGSHGTLFPAGDVEGLHAAMRSLAGDPVAHARLAASGREHVVRAHSWPAAADAYIALLAEAATK